MKIELGQESFPPLRSADFYSGPSPERQIQATPLSGKYRAIPHQQQQQQLLVASVDGTVGWPLVCHLGPSSHLPVNTKVSTA